MGFNWISFHAEYLALLSSHIALINKMKTFCWIVDSWRMAAYFIDHLLLQNLKAKYCLHCSVIIIIFIWVLCLTQISERLHSQDYILVHGVYSCELHSSVVDSQFNYSTTFFTLGEYAYKYWWVTMMRRSGYLVKISFMEYVPLASKCLQLGPKPVYKFPCEWGAKLHRLDSLCKDKNRWSSQYRKTVAALTYSHSNTQSDELWKEKSMQIASMMLKGCWKFCNSPKNI